MYAAAVRRLDVKRNGDVRTAQVKVDCTEEITVLGVLTAKDSRGKKLGRYKALIPLKARHPNGPGCPPTCFNGGVTFNGAALVVFQQA